MRKQALVVGVGEFDLPPPPVKEPDPGKWKGWGALEFASDRVREVAAVLAEIGHAPYGDGALQNPTLKDLEHALECALESTGPDGTLVFHLLSHGWLNESNHVLYVATRDSRHDAEFGLDLVSWLKKVEGTDRFPAVLLLLDVCHAGVAINAQWSEWPFRDVETERKVWVLGAVGARKGAYKARFSQSVALVLRRLRVDGGDGLGTDPAVEFVPLSLFAREVRREQTRLCHADNATPQYMDATPVRLGEEPPVMFFRNPRYSPDAAGQLHIIQEDGLREFVEDLDPVLDAHHYLSRALGQLADTGLGNVCLFSGRQEELEDLANWIDGNRDQDIALRVVTGSPGVGKSALLGILVCAAHPRLRDIMLNRLPRMPLPGRHDHNQLAAVHARGRQLEELVCSIARQLQFTEPAEGWTAAALVTLITKRAAGGRPPVLVVDALDEALRPKDVVDLLLLPLTRSRARPAGATTERATCRLLIGTRRWLEEFPALFDAARVARGLLDLDEIPLTRLQRELTEYAQLYLETSKLYSRSDMKVLRMRLAQMIATTLTDDRTPDSRGAVGAFLVTGLYLRHLVSLQKPVEVEELPAIGQQIPRTLGETMELYLSHLGTAWSRPILATLAHAKHPGLPSRLLGPVAAVLSTAPTDPTPTPPTDQELNRALNQAGFFLRRSIDDTDGTTLYRLFHQGLADYLRQNPLP